VFAVRKPGVIAGLVVAEAAFRMLDPAVTFKVEVPDGSKAPARAIIAHVAGDARALLSAERVALNFLGRMSGIATLTRTYVDAVAGTGATIVDTRKTTPNLRPFEKYAVRAGGAKNHRTGLYDAVLIKDNHIAAAGSITKAVNAARAGTAHMVKIEVEVDTLKQLEEALKIGVDTILLDNMPPDTLRKAVAMASSRAVLEASGNITIDTVRAVAETGVDYISSGAITHSAINLDLGLDF
jgi:nicotinate-nucleotide pyrophosphorylase (carboxylating)